MQSAITRPNMRLNRLDILRGLALLAMAIYHFCWDLESFGYLAPGATAQGGLKLFARCIASSFLFLVGFSLVLAHGKSIRWPSVGKRLLQIAGAAAAISALTLWQFPDSFIFFGILHQIALASLLGLLFLRLPPVLTLAIAVLVLVASHFWTSDLFNSRWLAWLGFAALPPRSNDFVPVFPWFAAVLIGIATARLFIRHNLLPILSGAIRPAWLDRLLSFLGRHSLAFYLLHQPILFGLVFLFAQLFPAALPDATQSFVGACVNSCQQTASEVSCQQFCNCVSDELKQTNLFDAVFRGEINQNNNSTVQEIAAMCSVPSNFKPDN